MRDLIDVLHRMKTTKRRGRPVNVPSGLQPTAQEIAADEPNETETLPVRVAAVPKQRTRYDPESVMPTDPEVRRKYHAARSKLREYWEEMEGKPIKGLPLHGVSSLKGKDKRDSDNE